MKQTGILIFAFVFFNFLSAILNDLGHVPLSKIVDYGWLALVIYSWVAIPVYLQLIEKEKKKFSFKPEF